MLCAKPSLPTNEENITPHYKKNGEINDGKCNKSSENFMEEEIDPITKPNHLKGSFAMHKIAFLLLQEFLHSFTASDVSF